MCTDCNKSPNTLDQGQLWFLPYRYEHIANVRNALSLMDEPIPIGSTDAIRLTKDLTALLKIIGVE